MYYIDLKSEVAKRYDPTKFMEWNEGIYDETTSYFIEQLLNITTNGSYQIQAPGRPDIYAYDIYGSTDNWQILLIYNNIRDLGELTVGRTLKYPAVSDLENLFFRLKALSVE